MIQFQLLMQACLESSIKWEIKNSLIRSFQFLQPISQTFFERSSRLKFLLFKNGIIQVLDGEVKVFSTIEMFQFFWEFQICSMIHHNVMLQYNNNGTILTL
eukprot:TRINITY_DN587_c0_g1_i6.p1 TRINITY_DN587_c0_g1~~TRINITY_DN587_c0_g1_i6.p1  ORF type:complete len:101 (+),score=23.72 TRINITY_DN587_c0_g1_i6:1541-1843(+)